MLEFHLFFFFCFPFFEMVYLHFKMMICMAIIAFLHFSCSLSFMYFSFFTSFLLFLSSTFPSIYIYYIYIYIYIYTFL